MEPTQQDLDFIDMLSRPEPLDDELTEHIYTDDTLGWEMLKHPLVFSIPYSPAMNPLLNRQFRHKTEALDRALESRDWHTWVWLHERPYRVDAFCEVLHLMTDAEYWPLLAHMWVDSENIRENYRLWETLITNDRPGREHFMDDEGTEALDALPDIIDIYQGHTLDRDDGWSWTTDEAKAVWFARRFGNLENSTPIVTVATVAKADVLGYLLSRGESEIITDPDSVTITRTYAPGEPE